AEIASADITDGIVAVGMVQQVEDFDAKLQASRLRKRKSLAYRKINIPLWVAAQHIAPHIAEVSSSLRRERGWIMRRWYRLTWLHCGCSKSNRIEVVTQGYVLHRRSATCPGRPVWTRPRNSVERTTSRIEDINWQT